MSVGCLVLGFSLGYNKMISERVASTLMTQDLEDDAEQAQDLQHELIDAQLSAEVNKAAGNQLRLDLTELRGINQDLQEELIFYKSLMAPSALLKGLQVAEFAVLPVSRESATAAPRLYQYELLLTQVAVRRSFIAGAARIDVVGQQGDDEAVLSLTELEDVPTYPLKFRFRFFQNLSGQIRLPEGFEPEKVLITVEEKGKEPIQEFFPWTV